MTTFEHAQVYMLKNPNSESVYIGSCTREDLNIRLKEHIKKFKEFINGRGTGHRYGSFEILKLGEDICIERVEKVTCSSMKELRAREQFYIDKYKDRATNINNAVVSEEEVQKYQKEWRGKNKEYIQKYNMQYISDNKEKLKEQWKEYSKEYYQNHHEEQKRKHNEYYEKNKDKITEQRRLNRDVINQKQRDRRAAIKAAKAKEVI